jgi:hypothetical protein
LNDVLVELASFLEEFSYWVRVQPDIEGAALVGSYAVMPDQSMVEGAAATEQALASMGAARLNL